MIVDPKSEFYLRYSPTPINHFWYFLSSNYADIYLYKESLLSTFVRFNDVSNMGTTVISTITEMI